MTLGFIVRLYNGISKNLSLGAYIPEQLFILLSVSVFARLETMAVTYSCCS